MSQYQYYEFLAIDRPLNAQQIKQVRAYSSRATITATSFRNEYNFGDFRGDPKNFIRYFFDLFLYFANWGSRELMFRLPSQTCDPAVLKPYCSSNIVSVQKSAEFLIIDISSHPEDGTESDCPDPEDLMATLSPIRAEVLSGDFRALYLAWLHGLYESEDHANNPQLEPPLPPGLRTLTTAQQSLIDLLQIDPDLISAAAEASPDRPTDLQDEGLNNWLITLPKSQKNVILLNFLNGTDPALSAKLRQQYHRSLPPKPFPSEPTRTVSSLLTQARKQQQIRQTALAEKRAREKQRRDSQAAATRAQHLHDLSGRQEKAWRIVHALVAERQSSTYQQAVTLLVDLREIATISGNAATFRQRFLSLRQLHQRKANLINLMAKAGL